MEHVRSNSSQPHQYHSLFHDARRIDGEKNNLFLFFQDVCNYVGIGKQNTQKNNILFQEMMCFYEAWENLELFLTGIWYDLMLSFSELDVCKKYLKTHIDFLHSLKRWDIHMAIFYEDTTPVWIVFAKQIQSENFIREQWSYFSQKITHTIDFNI